MGWSGGGVITAFGVNSARHARRLSRLLNGAASGTRFRGDSPLVSLAQEISVITFQADLVLILVIVRMLGVLIILVLIDEAPASLWRRLEVPGLPPVLPGLPASPVVVQLGPDIGLSLKLVLHLVPVLPSVASIALLLSEVASVRLVQAVPSPGGELVQVIVRVQIV